MPPGKRPLFTAHHTTPCAPLPMLARSVYRLRTVNKVSPTLMEWKLGPARESCIGFPLISATLVAVVGMMDSEATTADVGLLRLRDSTCPVVALLTGPPERCAGTVAPTSRMLRSYVPYVSACNLQAWHLVHTWQRPCIELR